MDYLIALVAAVLLGTGFVLQQRCAEEAPKAHFLHLRLLADLVRKPLWLLGVATMVLGQLTSAWVMGHLELSITEPLLATNLIFALILAVPLSGQRVNKAEIIGALILSGGVAVLSLSRSTKASSVSFGSFAYWPTAAAIGLVAYGLVRAGRRRFGQQRATLTGMAAGLIFGISDALTRRTVQILDTHPFLVLFTNWPIYCVLAAGFVGVWLMQSSFNAGPLHLSLPGSTAAEPVSGILLGMVVFGDTVSVSPGMLALRAAGIVALVVGVILVARAPALSNLHTVPAVPHGLVPSRHGIRARHQSRPGAGSGPAAESQPAAEPSTAADSRPAAAAEHSGPS